MPEHRFPRPPFPVLLRTAEPRSCSFLPKPHLSFVIIGLGNNHLGSEQETGERLPGDAGGQERVSGPKRSGLPFKVSRGRCGAFLCHRCRNPLSSWGLPQWVSWFLAPAASRLGWQLCCPSSSFYVVIVPFPCPGCLIAHCLCNTTIPCVPRS